VGVSVGEAFRDGVGVGLKKELSTATIKKVDPPSLPLMGWSRPRFKIRKETFALAVVWPEVLTIEVKSYCSLLGVLTQIGLQVVPIFFIYIKCTLSLEQPQAFSF